MIKLIVILAFILLTSTNLMSESNCFEISGEFEVWDGWPPSLRIHDNENDIWYGVPDDDESINKEFIERIKKGETLSGIFCLSKTGKEVNVPYQETPIILVKIIKYKLEKSINSFNRTGY